MSKMKSVLTNQQQFAHVAKPEIQRSTFDRSSGYKTTLDAGKLYPVFLDEALPGDTINLKAQLFGRMSTPLKPIMDNIFVDLHFFSVPARILWDNWERFNGSQDNPDSDTTFVIPTLTAPAVTGFTELSIQDYFGLPTKIPGIVVNSLPFRAYNLIWNEWYRDENLQNSVTVPKTDGGDSAANYQLLYRGKRKDYFTSCLPFAQKSEPVSIPLGTSAPIASSAVVGANIPILQKPSNTIRDITSSNANVQMGAVSAVPSGALYADLSSATATTVNALREAFQIQRMYEKDARGGTRYTELLKAHFGVTSPDARLQRPEFLGGGSSPISITPITQTSASESGSTPQANLAAMGTFSINNNGFVKSFTEHEYVIGLVSIRADLNYQQGINRLWSRETRFDFYWPSFAHLGEQAVLGKEIYADGTGNDETVFGYQERYAEYRYKPSLITGLYRSNAAQSLDLWHLAQDFGTRPQLNPAFIQENPPLDRVVAVPTEPKFLLDCYFTQTHARPMPTFSTPGLIDHF